MFTRRVLDLPSLTPGTDVETRLTVLEGRYRSLLDALVSDRIALNQPGAIDIADAIINATNGIKFQATQNASTDANTLDDYEEASSTPTVTSATGTLTTVSAALTYTKKGREISFRATITITTNGTGATAINFTLPFTAAARTSIQGFNRNTVVGLAGYVNSALGTIYKYDGTYPGADGYVLDVAGVIEV